MNKLELELEMKKILEQSFKDVNEIKYFSNVVKYVDVTNLNPHQLKNVLDSENVPQNCYFIINDNELYVCYDVTEELTDYGKLEIKKAKSFNTIAFRQIYKLLTNNMYMRIEPDVETLKEYAYNEVTPYNMYVSNKLDQLLNYYFLFYKKLDL